MIISYKYEPTSTVNTSIQTLVCLLQHLGANGFLVGDKDIKCKHADPEALINALRLYGYGYSWYCNVNSEYIFYLPWYVAGSVADKQKLTIKYSVNKIALRIVKTYCRQSLMGYSQAPIYETKKIRKVIAKLRSANVVKYAHLTYPGFPLLWEVRLKDNTVFYLKLIKNKRSQTEENPIGDDMKNSPEKIMNRSDMQGEDPEQADEKGKLSYKGQLISDAEKMAYRQGIRRATNMSRGLILYVAYNHLNLDRQKLSVLKDILESDAMKALLSYGLGQGVGLLPYEHYIMDKVAEEFRVAGLDLGAEAGLAKITGLVPQMLPAVLAFTKTIGEIASGEKTFLESVQAFAQVEEMIPQEIRIGIDEATRIASAPIRIVNNEGSLAEEEAVLLEKDAFNMPTSVMVASCK